MFPLNVTCAKLKQIDGHGKSRSHGKNLCKVWGNLDETNDVHNISNIHNDLFHWEETLD